MLKVLMLFLLEAATLNKGYVPPPGYKNSSTGFPLLGGFRILLRESNLAVKLFLASLEGNFISIDSRARLVAGASELCRNDAIFLQNTDS